MSGQQSTSTPKYPGFVKRHLRGILEQSQGLYEDPTKSLLPQLNKWTTQGLENQAGIASGPNSIAAPGLAEANKILSGGYLDVTQDPNYRRAIDQALGMTSQRFAGSGRVGSGAYAGAMSDAAAGVAAQMYDQERQRQMQALSGLPDLISSQYADASALQAAGQRMDEDIMARFDWPYAQLDRYANTVYGSPQTQIPGQRSSTPFNWTSAIGGMLAPKF